VADHYEERWRGSARALGLVLRRQTWRSHIADDFGTMMRSLGPAVSPGDGAARDTWMVGRRHGSHVVVAVTWPEAIASSTQRPVTDVVVAIDPPLLVGLRVASTDAPKLRAGPDFDVGHPELDAKFEISAFIRERAACLLLPLAERLLVLRKRSAAMLVTDNIVRVGFHGHFFDGTSLGPAIDGVIETAHALVERRKAMPFDPLRMKIEREINGIELEERFCPADGSPYADDGATMLAAPAIRNSSLDFVRVGGDVVITDTSGALGGGAGPHR
jgi:hypothetical protein